MNVIQQKRKMQTLQKFSYSFYLAPTESDAAIFLKAILFSANVHV